MEEFASSRLIWVLIATALLSLLHFESARQAYWLAYRRGHFTDGLWLGMLLGPLSLPLVGRWPDAPVPNIANESRLGELSDNPAGGRFWVGLLGAGLGAILFYFALAEAVVGRPGLASPIWLAPVGMLVVWLGALLLRHAHPPFSLLPVVEGEFPEEEPEFIDQLRNRYKLGCIDGRRQWANAGVLVCGGASFIALIAAVLLWLVESAPVRVASSLPWLGGAALLALLAYLSNLARERCNRHWNQVASDCAPTATHREYLRLLLQTTDYQLLWRQQVRHRGMVGCVWPLLFCGLLATTVWLHWRLWQFLAVPIAAVWIIEAVAAYRGRRRLRDCEAELAPFSNECRIWRRWSRNTSWTGPRSWRSRASGRRSSCIRRGC